jgi:hypothetical protein
VTPRSRVRNWPTFHLSGLLHRSFLGTAGIVDPFSPDEFLFYAARHAFGELPLLALLGWALGSLARATLNRRSAAVETTPP